MASTKKTCNSIDYEIEGQLPRCSSQHQTATEDKVQMATSKLAPTPAFVYDTDDEDIVPLEDIPSLAGDDVMTIDDDSVQEIELEIAAGSNHDKPYYPKALHDDKDDMTVKEWVGNIQPGLGELAPVAEESLFVSDTSSAELSEDERSDFWHGEDPDIMDLFCNPMSDQEQGQKQEQELFQPELDLSSNKEPETTDNLRIPRIPVELRTELRRHDSGQINTYCQSTFSYQNDLSHQHQQQEYIFKESTQALHSILDDMDLDDMVNDPSFLDTEVEHQWQMSLQDNPDYLTEQVDPATLFDEEPVENDTIRDIDEIESRTFNTHSYARDSQQVLLADLKPSDPAELGKLVYFIYVDPKSLMVYSAPLTKTNAAEQLNNYCLLQIVTTLPLNTFEVWERSGTHGTDGQLIYHFRGNINSAVEKFDQLFFTRTGYFWGFEPIRNENNQHWKCLKISYPEHLSIPEHQDTVFNMANTLIWKKDQEEAYVGNGGTRQRSDYLASILDDRFSLCPGYTLFVDDRIVRRLDRSLVLEAITHLRTIAQLVSRFDLYGPDRLSIEEWETRVWTHSDAYLTIIPHRTWPEEAIPYIASEFLIDQEILYLSRVLDMGIIRMVYDNDQRYGNTFADRHLIEMGSPGLRIREFLPRKRLNISNKFMVIPKHKEWKGISKIVLAGGRSEDWQIQDIVRVRRVGEEEAYDRVRPGRPGSKVSVLEERALWYNVKPDELPSILKEGIQMPDKQALPSYAGFGSGIYFTDSIAALDNLGNEYAEHRTMLLCQVQLGSPLLDCLEDDADAYGKAIRAGVWSVRAPGVDGPASWVSPYKDFEKALGNAKVPSSDKPSTSTNKGLRRLAAGARFWSQYVVYDPAQIRIRYVVRLKRQVIQLE